MAAAPAVGSEKAEKEKVLENVMRRRLEWEEWTAGEHVVEVRGVAWRGVFHWVGDVCVCLCGGWRG
jgi:hypothetical protein